MCNMVDFYDEVTGKWEDLSSVGDMKRRFTVLPGDVDESDLPADSEYGPDEMCLCYTDTLAIIQRSGLPFRESLCPGDYIVGPDSRIVSEEGDGWANQRLVDRDA